MIVFFTSILCAIWFKQELCKFPDKINQQIYQDMNSLFPLNFNLSELQEKSQLQYRKKPSDLLLFILFPLASIVFYSHSLLVIGIIFILIHLSFIDYHYFLTDIHYIAILFIFSLIELLLNQILIDIYLSTLIFTTLFFTILTLITQYLFKKTPIGSGDILLFIALSPLFDLQGILNLLLFSSLLGLFFTGGYWLIKQEKLRKLPFIPFITLGFLICLTST